MTQAVQDPLHQHALCAVSKGHVRLPSPKGCKGLSLSPSCLPSTHGPTHTASGGAHTEHGQSSHKLAHLSQRLLPPQLRCMQVRCSHANPATCNSACFRLRQHHAKCQTFASLLLLLLLTQCSGASAGPDSHRRSHWFQGEAAASKAQVQARSVDQPCVKGAAASHPGAQLRLAHARRLHHLMPSSACPSQCAASASLFVQNSCMALDKPEAVLVTVDCRCALWHIACRQECTIQT
jgi:hypothetical protein